MQIKEIMTKDVASAKPQDTIESVAQLMKQYDVGSVPVCDGNQVVGIVTDRDITLRCVAQGKDSKQVSARDVMTKNPVTANPTMDIHEAAKIMSSKQIRRLPIVDNHNFVGMIALGDIAIESKLTDNAGDALKDISTPSSSF